MGGFDVHVDEVFMGALGVELAGAELPEVEAELRVMDPLACITPTASLMHEIPAYTFHSLTTNHHHDKSC